MKEDKVSPEEVRRMASLSRLKVDDEELKLFCRQFSQILDHMDILAAVDTQGVEPCYSPIFHTAALRDDKVNNRRSRGEVLSNAPETDGQYFIVPRII